MAPRDAMVKQIEEQYAEQKGVGPTGQVLSPEETARQATLVKPPTDTSQIPLADTHLLQGEEPITQADIKPAQEAPKPTPPALQGRVTQEETTAQAPSGQAHVRLPGETDAEYTERVALTNEALTTKELQEKLASDQFKEPTPSPEAQALIAKAQSTKEPANPAEVARSRQVAEEAENRIASGEKISSVIPNERESDQVAREGETSPDFAARRARQGGAVALPTETAQRAGSAIATEGRSWGRALKGATDTFNRIFGTGLGLTEQEKGVRQRFTATGSQLDQDRSKAQEVIRPFRDEMDKWTPQQKTDFVDAVSAGKDSPDPKFQPVVDFLRNINDGLKARATKLGLGKNWNRNWFHFEAQWEGDPQGTGHSISGPETFNHPRESENFTDFQNRIATTGGTLKYDNPLDMYMNGLNEVNRSLTGREFVQHEQEAGPGGGGSMIRTKILPEGFDWIDDKLAKNEEGKGRLAAPQGIADTINQFTAPSAIKSGSLLDKIGDVTRLTTAANFALSAYHASTSAFSNAILQSAQAVDDLMNLQGGQIVTHLKDALNYPGSIRKGSIGRQVYAGIKDIPEMKPIMDAIRDSGARIGQPDMLDRSQWQQAVD